MSILWSIVLRPAGKSLPGLNAVLRGCKTTAFPPAPKGGGSGGGMQLQQRRGNDEGRATKTRGTPLAPALPLFFTLRRRAVLKQLLAPRLNLR